MLEGVFSLKKIEINEDFIARGLCSGSFFSRKKRCHMGTLFFDKKPAKPDTSVLILGEAALNGRLATNSIHCKSSRRNKHFKNLNCGKLNGHLVESEFLGPQKDAFSGAFINKHYLINIADGGTFFFDWKGDIILGLQAKMPQISVRNIG